MFFDILYFIGLVFVVGFIVPGITRYQPSFLKILIWATAIIVAVGVAILRFFIAKKDYEKDTKTD
jgi:flagellar motor component MotA